jgi:hypothetical protein
MASVIGYRATHATCFTMQNALDVELELVKRNFILRVYVLFFYFIPFLMMGQ